MPRRPHPPRREFLAAAGGLLGAIASAAHAPGAAAGTPRAGGPPAARDPGQLRSLLEALDAQSARYWSVPRKDGELLRFLVKATRARSVLEIGTSQGVSAIWMGLALEETDGRLTTIEIDRGRHDLARRHIGEAGLSGRVALIHGDAHAMLPALPGPYDFVFMDADKEGQVAYFHALHPRRLSPGAVIAVHNAIRQAGAMRDYLDLVQTHPDFDTIILSATMDDGFCLSYRRRTP
jgi:predicted O-methyltransferase YrrM